MSETKSVEIRRDQYDAIMAIVHGVMPIMWDDPCELTYDQERSAEFDLLYGAGVIDIDGDATDAGEQHYCVVLPDGWADRLKQLFTTAEWVD